MTDGQHSGAPGAPPHDAPRPAPPESTASSSAPAAGAVKVPEGAFGVTLPTFDGPLDLLLTLIQEHKLDIFDIPISFVVDKYLEYMEAARALNIDLAGEYLLMGATLAYIKSRMLLPQGKSADGGPEGEVGPDPREELVRRLLEYQKYKHAAAMLARHPQLGRDVFVRRAKEELPLAPDEIAYMKSPEVSVYRLIEALARVLKERKIEIPHEVFVERLSIGDRIATITDRLRLEERITFTSLFEDLTQLDKHRVVPTFLAVLEMTKLKLLRVHQPDHHGEIYLSRSGALLTGAVEGVALDYRG